MKRGKVRRMAEYIEREALIKRLEHEADCSTSLVDVLVINGLANLVRDERLAPTTDVVEVKHGEWLKTDAYPHRVYCSLCYKTYVTNEEIIRGRSDGHPTYCREAKYCPHCGAKMDLKEGAEE
jgi:hypothetical protein